MSHLTIKDADDRYRERCRDVDRLVDDARTAQSRFLEKPTPEAHAAVALANAYVLQAVEARTHALSAVRALCGNPPAVIPYPR